MVISEPPEQERLLLEQLDGKSYRSLDGLRRAASTAKRPVPPALRLPKIRRSSGSRLSFGNAKDGTNSGQIVLVQTVRTSLVVRFIVRKADVHRVDYRLARPRPLHLP